MARKSYWIYSDKYLSHNYMLLRSIESELRISSITTLAGDGEETEILKNPIDIGTAKSLRYPPIVSDRIRVTIDHPLSDVLTIDQLVKIDVGLDNYETMGTYQSEIEVANFNKNLTVVYDIENTLDALFRLELHISVVDNYENIVYSSIIPISINDDGWMVEHGNSGSGIDLPYEPVEESMYILIDGSSVDNFEVEDKRVKFSMPEGYDCFVVYKPKFIEQGGLYEFSKDVSLTPSYGMVLRDDYCNKVEFSIILNSYNPDITSINHTPIIKSLGIMTSDK
ncbi:MAG: hypothetical protein DRQ78_00165 [Epsilonproteobacteria bacterium]|nr:MAG: hypothetical protein DRQ78_00165 [Campylobacterota bacterium]